MRFIITYLLVFAAGAVVAEEKPADQAAAWLKGLGEKGIVISKSAMKEDAGFTAAHGRSAVGEITKFSFQQPGWWVTVAFKGTHDADTPLKTLQKNFWYATIDKMPTPGLKIPDWEIKPQTPTSSFSKGVELVEYGKGKMKVAIKTNAFALYGRNTAVLVPADAPTPEGAYFQIRQDIPIQLTITAPVQFK